MTPTLLYVDPIFCYLLSTFAVEHITVIDSSYNKDMGGKFHIPLLTPLHKESNLEALDVDAFDSQTL